MKNGFTLIEILLVLAITVMITIVALLLYNKVSNEKSSSEAIKELNGIQSNIKSLYISDKNYSSLTIGGRYSNNKLIPFVFPGSMIENDGVYNAYGSSSVNIFGYNDYYYISYPIKPLVADCVKIINAVKDNFYKIELNSYGVIKDKYENNNDDEPYPELNSTNISEYCNEESNSGVGVIILRLYSK